jgi:hypothetical protein
MFFVNMHWQVCQWETQKSKNFVREVSWFWIFIFAATHIHNIPPVITRTYFIKKRLIFSILDMIITIVFSCLPLHPMSKYFKYRGGGGGLSLEYILKGRKRLYTTRYKLSNFHRRKGIMSRQHDIYFLTIYRSRIFLENALLKISEICTICQGEVERLIWKQDPKNPSILSLYSEWRKCRMSNADGMCCVMTSNMIGALEKLFTAILRWLLLQKNIVRITSKVVFISK